MKSHKLTVWALAIAATGFIGIYLRMGGDSGPVPVQSSGRLPKELQGIRLGDTYDDVLAQHPGRTPDASQSKDGIFLSTPQPGVAGSIVYFEHGRAFQISAFASEMSPSEAREVAAAVSRRLGKPDSVTQIDPRQTTWIWNDGDIKMRFNDEPAGGCPSDSRDFGLDLIDWRSKKRHDAALASSSRQNKNYEARSEFLRRASHYQTIGNE